MLRSTDLHLWWSWNNWSSELKCLFTVTNISNWISSTQALTLICAEEGGRAWVEASLGMGFNVCMLWTDLTHAQNAKRTFPCTRRYNTYARAHAHNIVYGSRRSIVYMYRTTVCVFFCCCCCFWNRYLQTSYNDIHRNYVVSASAVYIYIIAS